MLVLIDKHILAAKYKHCYLQCYLNMFLMRTSKYFLKPANNTFRLQIFKAIYMYTQIEEILKICSKCTAITFHSVINTFLLLLGSRWQKYRSSLGRSTCTFCYIFWSFLDLSNPFSDWHETNMHNILSDCPCHFVTWIILTG